MMLRGGELDGARLLSSRTIDLMTVNHLPGDVDLTEFAVDSYAEDEYARCGLRFRRVGLHDGSKNKSLVSDGSFAWGGAASTTFWVDPLRI